MVLVNGSRGIGTGFSTDIMCYNPKQIIEYLEAIINGVDIEKRKCLQVDPFYRGFNGTIKLLDNEKSKKKYIIKGVYSVIGKDKIKITELPVGTWTQDYKEYLESIVASNNKERDRDKSKKTKTVEFMIKDYTNMSTDTTVEFTVTLLPGSLDKLLSEKQDDNINGIERAFKLYTTQNTSNMHLFDSNEKLKQYTSVELIIEDYYHIRYSYYQKRKEYLITKLGNELNILYVFDNNYTEYDNNPQLSVTDVYCFNFSLLSSDTVLLIAFEWYTVLKLVLYHLYYHLVF